VDSDNELTELVLGGKQNSQGLDSKDQTVQGDDLQEMCDRKNSP